MADILPTWNTFSRFDKWRAGVTTGIGTPPTMAQVNALNGENQAIAYLNRKQSQLNGASALPYVSPNGTMSASSIAAVRTAINALRAYIGMSSYTFTGLDTASRTCQALTLNELQLAQSYTRSILQSSTTNSQSWLTTAVYAAYGTSTYSSYASTFLGKVAVGGGQTQRRRFGQYFALPNIGSNATATMNLSVGAGFTSGEAYLPELYISNSDDSAFAAGWEAHLSSGGTNVGSFLLATGANFLTISNALLAAHSGGNMSCIVGSNLEMTDAGVRANAGFQISSMQLDITY